MTSVAPWFRAPATSRRLPLATTAALAFGLLGHAYGLSVLLTSLDRMRSVSGAFAVYGLGVGVVVAAVVLALRRGVVATGWLSLLGVALLGADVGNALLVKPEAWSETAFWTIGTGAVSTLVLALLAEVGPVLVVLVAHVAVVLLCLIVLSGAGEHTVDRAVLTAVDALAIPVLGICGAGLYRRALSTRAEALARAEAAEQALAEAAEAEQLALDELAWLTDQAVPLLTRVADGGLLSAAEAGLLDRVAIRLRRELLADPERPGLEALVPRQSVIDLEILDPDDVGPRLAPQDRALLGGLLASLAAGDRPGWGRVVLIAGESAVHLTLYAEGAAAVALAGESVGALLDQLQGRVSNDAQGVVAEAMLSLAGSRGGFPSPRTGA